MTWTIPGTVLSAKRDDAKYIQQQFTSMFFGGGIMLSQVAGITGLEPYTVQNWVKREFLPAPDHKRYNMNQLCRIVIINALKSALPMEKIIQLICYVNGELDDEQDDLIDDATLYFLFVRLASRAKEGLSPGEWESFLDHELQDYAEPVPGAKGRVKKALWIMLTAWSAAKLQKQAEDLLAQL